MTGGTSPGKGMAPRRGQMSEQRKSHPGEVVVLIHGFMAHRLLLSPLATRLRGRGWHSHAWGYPSLRPSVLTHAVRFRGFLEELQADPAILTMHVVAHSMGCIISRAALANGPPEKFGRLVMLAPPNRGSFVATATAGLIGRLLRPVKELSTHPRSLVNTLDEPQGIEIGVIAAGFDQLVSLESTRLSVPHRHMVIPCMHSSLLFRRDVADLTDRFLEHGDFDAADTEGHDRNEINPGIEGHDA